MKFLFPLAKRFIAGYDFESAKPVIENLHNEGYDISIDYLGELSKTRDDCLDAFIQYCDIMDYYQSRHWIDLSIKPTQLGLKFDKEYCYDLMDKLARKSSRYGMTIRLDMEDRYVTQDTIDLCLMLNKKYGNVGMAIQANLIRTNKDIVDLMSSNVSLRLVKGAYKEDIKNAYQNKLQIERLFVKHAFMLLSDRCRTYYHMRDDSKVVSAIGTHDENILKEITKNMGAFNITREDCDFEFLYGIRRDLSEKMKNDGYMVRLYIPFGKDWLPYTLRRLKEYKNLKFVVINLFREFFGSKP